jgi:DNA-binding transcriptional regulator YiaG
VTTATKTRPKKKTTRGGKTTKKKPTSKKAKTKKPKWSVITFKKIEQWRGKLGLSKSGMAEALEVTNSTYHNWRRGTTVPHPNQQDEILLRIQALENNVGTTNGSAGSSSQNTGTSSSAKGSGKNGGQTKGRGRSSGQNKGRSTGRGSSSSSSRSTTNGASGGRFSRSAENGATEKGRASLGTHPTQHKVPRDDIAAITVAFIQSQKKAVSAGSIYKFVEGLREVL